MENITEMLKGVLERCSLKSLAVAKLTAMKEKCRVKLEDKIQF